MHSLEVIEAKNLQQVDKELREAILNEDYTLARRIARSNPGVYVMDGRHRDGSRNVPIQKEVTNVPA